MPQELRYRQDIDRRVNPIMGKSRATSFDVAFTAGVSQATVSRALSGSKLVSEETRARIQAIATQLNYKVDKHASALRRQHATTIALLLFEDPTSDDSLINPFFLSMIGHLTQSCARAGYDLLVSFQQQSQDWHADFLDNHKADGLILLGYGDYLAYQSRLEQLAHSGTLFVRWGGIFPDQLGASVGCNNQEGGFNATGHLLGLGRRKLAFLGTATPAFPEFFARHEGFLAAHAKVGLAADTRLAIAASDSTETDGYRAASLLLESKIPFDGIIAASDLIAIGAIRALADAGLRVPEDIAVVGFDDMPAARFGNPALSTVLQDTKRAAELLVELIVRQIGGEKVQSQIIPAPLIVRESCGAKRICAA
jgi:DNA-binding LacI/PurR family transcriptional regulator